MGGFGGYFNFDPGGGNALDLYEQERKRKQMEEQERKLALWSRAQEVEEENPGSQRGGGNRESAYDPVQRGLGIAEGRSGQDYLDRYAEHLSKRPKPSDYKPSTLRKVLATIAGTLTGSPELSRGISWGKYGEALSDWEAGGAGLEDVAKLESEHAGSRRTLGGRVLTADVKRMGDVEDYALGQARVGVDAANLEVRKQELEEKIRHAKTTEERDNAKLELDRVNTALRRAEHALDVEEFGEEKRQFGITSGLDERDVAARESRAATYGRNVDSLAEARKGGKNYGTQLTPAQERDADLLAAERAIQENPDWERFLDKDGNIQMDYEWKNFDATDRAEFDKFKSRVQSIRDSLYPNSRRQTRWYGDSDPYGEE